MECGEVCDEEYGQYNIEHPEYEANAVALLNGDLARVQDILSFIMF
jgi:hypothetical protein